MEVQERPQLRRRRNRAEKFQSWTGAEGTLKVKLVYWGLVLVQVALWLAMAWVLSHLHMGAPCFVVALLLWIYNEPLKALFSRAKAKICPFNKNR